MASRLERLGSPAPFLQLTTFPAHGRGSVGDDCWRHDSGDDRPATGRLIVSPAPHGDGVGGEWCCDVRGSPVHRALSWSYQTEADRSRGAENFSVTNGTLSPIVAAGMVGAASATCFVSPELATCDKEEVSERKERFSSSGRRSVVLRAKEDDPPVWVSPHRVDCSSSSPHEGNDVDKPCSTFHPYSTLQQSNSQPVVAVSVLLEMMSAIQHSIQQLGSEVKELRLTLETVKIKLENGGREHSAQHDTTEPLGGSAAAVQNECNHIRPSTFIPPPSSPPSSWDSCCLSTHSSPPLRGSEALLDADIVKAMTDGLKELESLPCSLPAGHRLAIEKFHNLCCGRGLTG
ncbi:uncharacterized protein TM35_000351930 [Trypanosoma theileri]|uniref:Uncharacterized protein n=1 Tax=Trypanosoma theileri TaxID=67003 RepID=A0A1X0NMS6_9TRYP|nr:uncharacterized protein TM35_000351930 [Trypanosoma theileri]ORC85449.1 hypothetical protein TM35_000351930 [Trypanosoma theileri]